MLDAEARFLLDLMDKAQQAPVDERGRATDTISATNESWAFFRRFRLPAEPAGN